MQANTPKKKWLVISHGFNMDGRAASLTVTDKIPYLMDAGIEPIVLSAITGEKDSRFPHYQLLPWGPAGLRFDFRHYVATKYGRGWMYKILTPLVSALLLPFTALEKLLIGLSSQSSWSFAAAHRGEKIIKKQQIELIYSSGGAWSAHYAAYLIKKLTGKKWIAEIHDPMVIRDDPQDNGTAPRKSKDKRFLQRLEGLICRDADQVWWFTQGALDYAKLRHPVLGDKGFVVLPGALPPGCEEPLPTQHLYQAKLHIAHFGSLANDRSLAPVLAAIAPLLEANPTIKSRLQIDVYGAALDQASVDAIQQLHLEEIVQAHGRIENDPVTGKTGRERVMEIMRAADVLLLLHGDYEWCAEYIPSKSYDYFWSGRPIWGITNRNPFFDEMLTERGAYISHTLDPASILQVFQRIEQDWQAQAIPTRAMTTVTPQSAVETILKRVAA